MKKQSIFLVIGTLMFGVIALTLYTFVWPGYADIEVADKGILNVSSWNEKTIVPLNGEWEFYWQKFLEYDDFNKDKIQPDVYSDFPSTWNRLELDGKKLPGKGYATYRLHVTGVKSGQTLAMIVSPVSTAYELFANDELIASNGRVGTNEESYGPQWEMQVVEFTTNSDSFDIIMHVSNFVYARGGAWNNSYFGKAEVINKAYTLLIGGDMFYIILFFVLVFVCLALYSFLRDERILLIAGQCLFLCLRTTICNSYCINIFFPSVSFEYIVRLSFAANYMSLSFLYYFYLTYQDIMPRSTIDIIALSFSFLALFLLMPIYQLTKLTTLLQLSVFLISVFVLYYVFIALNRKEKTAKYILVGIIALFVCLVHDLLKYNFIINLSLVNNLSLGYLMMLYCWGCSLFFEFADSMKERDKAQQTLIEKCRNENLLELKLLKSQIKPHFINNTLTSIIYITRTDIEYARHLLVEFSKYLRSFYYLGDLKDLVNISEEIEFVKSYVELERACYHEKLQVEFNIETEDIMIPSMVLQPLIENAIIHGTSDIGNRDLKINIYVKDEGDNIRIGVRDDGCGINEKEIDNVLTVDDSKNSIGIQNINQRLNKLFDANLQIVSSPGNGTDIFVVIDKQKM